MNEYGFFGSKNKDRTYSSDDFSAFFSDIFTDGVLGNSTSNLQVVANGNLSLTVKSGTAYIGGRFFRPIVDKTVTLDDSDATYARYDLIVLRCDYVNREIYLDVITGIPSATPAVPELQRNTNVYDLGLASVHVKSGALSVTQSDIRDLRFDNNYCGVVTGVVDTINTTDLFAQYEAQWELLRAACAQDEAAVIAAWESLNTVKKVNGIEPVNGNISMPLNKIPNGGGYYKSEYYIQAGTYNVTGGTATITFGTAYKDVPYVFVSYTASEASNSTPIVTSRSKTGFTVKKGTTAAYAGFDWVAFGKI